MKKFVAILFILVLMKPLYSSEQGRFTLLSPQATQLKQNEVETLSDQKSVKHADGGYIENAAVVDCFAALSYRYTGGRYQDEEIPFRLHSPEQIQPDKKCPLLIWLHGAGESGDDNKRQLAHMQSTIEFLTRDRQIDFYLLATQCPVDNKTWENSLSPEGKGDAPLTIMKEILDSALEDYPIDQNRISIYGQCSGAHGAWCFLEKYPNLVSAIAAFSTTPPSGYVWDARYQKTSFWAFNNLDDSDVPIEPMQTFVKQINDSGGLGYLTIGKGGGHDTWGRAMRKHKVVGWLVLQDREHFAPPPGVIVNPHTSLLKQCLLYTLPVLLFVLLVIYRRKRKLRNALAAHEDNAAGITTEPCGIAQPPHRLQGDA